MAFHEVQFPTGISFRSRGGPGFKTNIVPTDSGGEYRVSRWNAPRRRYEVAEGAKALDAVSTLLDFYIARNGSEHGFRFKDHLDFTTATNHRDAPASDDHEIGTGDGTETQFQIVKKYPNAAGSDISRAITKPVSGTVVVEVNGSTATADALGWSVDTTSGIITFTTAPTSGHSVKAGCEFDVPCRFSESDDDLFDFSYDSFNTGSAQVELIEIIDGLQTPEDMNYGGAETVDMVAADTVMAVGGGKVKSVTCTTADTKAIMPDSTNLPLGGPYFYIINSGAEDIAVTDEDTTSLLTTLAPGGDLAMVLEDDGAGGGQWAVRVVA